MNKEYEEIEKIERYLEGRMEGEELAAFEKAMADGDGKGAINCASASASASVSTDDYLAAVNAIKVYNHSILKNRLRQIHKDVVIQAAAIKTLRRWYWAAAIFVVMVCVGFAMVYLFGDETGKSAEDNIVKLEQEDKTVEEEKVAAAVAVTEEEVEVAVAVAEENKKLIAANYKKNPKYESLIGTIYRAADINILTPDTSATYAVNDTIVFSWEGDVDEELILKIVDNHEKPVYEIRLRDVHEYKWSNKPEPGLYYWMLETEDDNLGYGRFLIR